MCLKESYFSIDMITSCTEELHYWSFFWQLIPPPKKKMCGFMRHSLTQCRWLKQHFYLNGCEKFTKKRKQRVASLSTHLVTSFVKINFCTFHALNWFISLSLRSFKLKCCEKSFSLRTRHPSVYVYAYFFKWAIPGLFPFIFVFSNKQYNFYNKFM